jgi:hypothetical protein
MTNSDWIYDDIAKSFAKTLDRMGRGEREDGNEKRRQITLDSFSRYVKPLYLIWDFSEWFIGHSGSTYWPKKIQRKQRYFSRLNPIWRSWTFTNWKDKGQTYRAR